MRVTIIKEDNTVYIDRVAKSVDCSDLPEDFHALQWNNDTGWVEFIDNYKSPEQITSLEPYQKYIDAWYAVVELPPVVDTPIEPTANTP